MTRMIPNGYRCMARFRADFTIFPRKLATGRRVWYYRSYDGDVRTPAHSTGIEVTGPTSRARAMKFCTDLLVSGAMHRPKERTFAKYAEGWFTEGSCAWLADRMASGAPGRPAISRAYLANLAMHLRLYLVPFFGRMKMADLKPSRVKEFRLWMQGKGLSNKTINAACDAFRIMTDWALADGTILADPFRGVQRFFVAPSTRRAYTLDEVRGVMSAAWENQLVRLFCLVGASTGMRFSEIRAIRRETLAPDHIDVRDQFARDRLAPVKTKEARKVPIPPALYAMLAQALADGAKVPKRWDATDEGFVFTMPGSTTPLAPSTVTKQLERRSPKDPGLCFHSFRHFFNTWLMAENVPPAKVRAVMGHSEGRGTMTAVYTDWSPEMFPEVYAAQGKLMGELLEK